METITYSGLIQEGEYGENWLSLYVGEGSDPIAKVFEEDFSGNNVTIRYWLSEVEMKKNKLKENTLLCISGAVDADYSSKYSEITGYLWTDEDINVGGHDLMSELRRNIGKYLYMEVDIH